MMAAGVTPQMGTAAARRLKLKRQKERAHEAVSESSKPVNVRNTF